MTWRVGCMACSGDFCNKCQHWTAVDERAKWGTCQFFTDNPGVPMRIYTGNIQFGPPVRTTSQAKCRNFKGEGEE